MRQKNLQMGFIGLTLSLILAAVAVIGGYAQEDSQQEMLQLGARLYTENCEACHGENGTGRVGATLSKDWPSIRPDLTVENTIRNGVEGSVMPAWSQENGGPLSEAEIDDIVAFVLTLSDQGEEVVFTPQPEPETLPSDWVGIVITVVLLAVVVGLILLLQRRR